MKILGSWRPFEGSFKSSYDLTPSECIFSSDCLLSVSLKNDRREKKG